MTFVTREIHLASRPVGWPTHDNFRLVENELPEPGPGQILVRNTVMSVDPYMRGRMNAGKSYIPPFAVDAPLEGGAVGEVIKSSDDAFAVGDMVVHDHGWREHAVVDAVRATPIDTGRAPASAYLGVLGMTGLTAYTGLVRIAELEPGDIVFVSGAAGAVGSAVGQIAQNLGAAKVIGSAAHRRRSATSSTNSASTPPSTTTTDRSPNNSPSTPRTASTSTSTTSAASIWKARSPTCGTSAGSPCAAPSRRTTTTARSTGRAIWDSPSCDG